MQSSNRFLKFIYLTLLPVTWWFNTTCFPGFPDFQHIHDTFSFLPPSLEKSLKLQVILLTSNRNCYFNYHRIYLLNKLTIPISLISFERLSRIVVTSSGFQSREMFVWVTNYPCKISLCVSLICIQHIKDKNPNPLYLNRTAQN